MSPLLAWLRVLPFLFLFSLTLVHAREESIFTSSVTYCNPPETLLVQRFEVAYFRANASVSFNVSVSSVQPDVNVTANLFLNAYGLSPVNITLDLCNLFDGALCPLPMYNFTGADSITLPDSLGVEGKLPAIAFKIPDLEGYAQLSLTDINTDAIRACVQTTISNGLSAYQPAVGWTSRGITLAAFIMSLLHSVLISPDTLVALRFLDLFQLFQAIAASALLNLNYPSVYRSFALNFAWAVGIVGMEGSPVQGSIDRMRALTGGHVQDDTGGTAIDFVNRRLSPYNSPNPAALLQQVSQPIRRAVDSASSSPSRLANLGRLVLRSKVNLPDTIRGDVQTVTPSSSNVLQAGLPIYVNTLFVPTANAFMTVFIVVLCLFAVLLTAGVLILGAIFVVTKYKAGKNNEDKGRITVKRFLADCLPSIRAWLIRLAIVVSPPLAIFAFFQLSLKDSGLSIFFAVATLVAILASFILPTLHIRQFVKNAPEGSQALYPSLTTSPSSTLSEGPENASQRAVASYAPLYAHHRPERYWYTIYIILPSLLLRAILIALFRFSPEAQLSLLLILDVALLALQFALKPCSSSTSSPNKKAHVFSAYMIATRVCVWGVMIGFLERVGVTPIGRVVIGIVGAVVWAVCVVVCVGALVWSFGEEIWISLRGGAKGTKKSGKRREAWQHDSEGSILEKGVGGSGGSEKKNSNEKSSSPSPSPSSADASVIDLNSTGGPISTSTSTHLHLPLPTLDNASSFMNGSTISHQPHQLDRPLNPTPDHLVPLDSYVLAPYYPISPTGSTVTSLMDPPSIYSGSQYPYYHSNSNIHSTANSRPPSESNYSYSHSRRNSSDAGTILTNVGSVLPRRWSFYHTAPPSGTAMSHGHPMGGGAEPGSPGASSLGHYTVGTASSVGHGPYAHGHHSPNPMSTSGGLSPGLGPSSAAPVTVSRNPSLRVGYTHQHADIQEETASASERSLKTG